MFQLTSYKKIYSLCEEL